MSEFNPIRDGQYVAMACMGDCKVCGRRQDLRCGACFDCSRWVSGEIVSTGVDGTAVHRLWDHRNPTNVWHVQVAPLPTEARHD